MWEDDAPATVGGQPAEAPPDPASKTGGGKGKDDSITLSRKDHEALMKRVGDLESSERYWSEKARGGKSQAEPEPDPEPEEEDIFADIPEIEDIDPEKFTDELSSKGRKALEDMGFVDKKRMKAILAKQEARFMGRMEQLIGQKINGAQQAMLKDAELLSTYPELNNPKSEFFKRTQETYKELVAEEPALKRGGAGLKIAAKMVRAELGRQTSRRADVDDRIARQQGDMTGQDGEEGEDLTPAQKDIIRKFNADGGPQVSEESYKARARRGVNMGSKAYQPGSMRW